MAECPGACPVDPVNSCLTCRGRLRPQCVPPTHPAAQAPVFALDRACPPGCPGMVLVVGVSL